MKVKVVVFLQNAWSPVYANGTWPRDSWLKALGTSRTGQRLRTFEHALSHPGREFKIYYDNTTPIVGADPFSVVPADLVHIKQVLLEQKPDVVVALGKQALVSLRDLWTDPFVVGPHPAYRVATNAVFEMVAELTATLTSGVVEQKRSGVEVSELPARTSKKKKARD